MPSIREENKVHICGTVSERDEDKYNKTGFTPRKGNKVDSYIIEECPVNIEC